MRSIAGVTVQPANEELGGSVLISESLVMMLPCRGVVVLKLSESGVCRGRGTEIWK